jgi:hypothetical protein
MGWCEVANTPVSATIPTVVYTPSAGGVPHAYLSNRGSSPVYLGGSGVSSATGFLMPVGGRIEFPNAGSAIYAVSGYQAVSPQGTVITAVAAQAGTTLTNAAGTAFTAGMWIAIETGTPRQELVQVNGNNAGSVFTNTPLQFAHGTATTFSQVTASPSLVISAAVGAT